VCTPLVGALPFSRKAPFSPTLSEVLLGPPVVFALPPPLISVFGGFPYHPSPRWLLGAFLGFGVCPNIFLAPPGRTLKPPWFGPIFVDISKYAVPLSLPAVGIFV